MSNIELQTGLDFPRFTENYGIANKEVREKQVKIYHRELAWKYTLAHSIDPIANNLEFIQTYLNDDISELNLQILVFYKRDIQPAIDLFIDSGDWKSLRSEDREQFDIVQYNNCIRYMLYPTDTLWKTLQKRFKLGGSIIYFRINLDFFPDEDGECKIVSLGKQEVSYTKHVFSVECKDGADLWENSQ